MDQETSRQLTSTLLTQSETIHWKIYNVSDLLKNNAWTAYSIRFEVGFGPTELSRWDVSLYSNGKVLQLRAKLLAPEGQKVTHRLKSWVLGTGSSVDDIMTWRECSDDSPKAKETSVSWHSTFWKVVSMEDLQDPKTGILYAGDDSMELKVKLTVFGADVS